MRIIQITDLHINSKNETINGVDTRKNFINILKQIKPLAFDFMVITGDLSFFDGDVEVYKWIKKQIHEYNIRNYYVIGGNHDNADLLAKTFDLQKNLFNHEMYYFKEPNFIFLDTIKGYCSEKQLSWFENTIKIMDYNPIIFMHHPPFATAIGHMDKDGFEGRKDFEHVVQNHSQVERIVCGHLHRPIFRQFGGTIVSVCPGIGMQLALDLRPEAPSGFIMEPPAVMLHLLEHFWDEDPVLLTHISLIEEKEGQFGGFHPFFNVVNPK
jgi:3',5'-cyclic AMP phosphodiesterase CpdA